MDVAGNRGLLGIDIGVGIHPDERKLLRGVVLRGARDRPQPQGVVAAQRNGKDPGALGRADGIPGGGAGGKHLGEIVGGRLLLPTDGKGDKGGIRRCRDTVMGEEREQTVFAADEGGAAHGAAGGAAAQLQRSRDKRKPHGGSLPFTLIGWGIFPQIKP